MEDGIGISWRVRRSAIFIFASLVSSMKVFLPSRIAPLLIIRTCCLSFIDCIYETRRALVVVCILCQKENTLPLSPFSGRSADLSKSSSIPEVFLSFLLYTRRIFETPLSRIQFNGDSFAGPDSVRVQSRQSFNRGDMPLQSFSDSSNSLPSDGESL